jgi:hypothetical protein
MPGCMVARVLELPLSSRMPSCITVNLRANVSLAAVSRLGHTCKPLEEHCCRAGCAPRPTGTNPPSIQGYDRAI